MGVLDENCKLEADFFYPDPVSLPDDIGLRSAGGTAIALTRCTDS
jgi:hypothetical protein